MNKFGITFWFYAKDQFKKKALIIYGVFFLLTLGGMFALNHFGGGYSEIAIVQNSSEFTVDAHLLDGLENRNFLFLDSESVARQLLEDGEVEDVFIIKGTDAPELTILSSHSTADSLVEMTVTQVLTAQNMERVMTDYDLPPSAVLNLMSPIAVNFETAEEMTDGMVAADIINFILPMAVMMTLTLTGQMVANSVSAEKNSRVMEVMMAKVHPTYSMLAKVLSAFVGFLIPFVAIGLGILAAEVIGWVDLQMFGELISEFFPGHVLLLTLAVFILGYFCFIFLFAAAGAISASVESLTTTLAPVTYGIMVPYFLAVFMSLDHAVMNVLVYVPITSPFILVQRYLRGYSNNVEVWISLALMVLFAFATLWVSARLYMNGVSHTSEKVTFGDLKKMMQK